MEETFNFNIAAFDSTKEYPSAEENKRAALDIYQQKTRKLSKFNVEVASAIFSKIVGQEDVIGDLLRLLRSWYLQKSKSKPLSLLFAGVSGTGKTFTANRIAEVFGKMGYLYHEEDMTQYVSEHDISRFIGSAEGFVGSDKPPLIVEKLKIANGKMVICFDEIDKAHPNIMTSFMQMMDQGRLKTNKEEYDLKDSVLVFTSNGAMDELTRLKTTYKGDPKEDEFQKEISVILGRAGFPSFILGRLEKIFIFNPFYERIVLDLAIAETQKFIQSYDSSLNVCFIDPELLVNITKNAAGSNQGARQVAKSVKSEISEAVLTFLEEQDGFNKLSIIKEGSQVKIIENTSVTKQIDQCRKEALTLLGIDNN